ncbi:DMT family transporter [Thalassospira mesophila]|uniref:EamA domain-containing protein n=1 Tax=Thalassospira mesophila TaxID=1293891 RepID=A0A1Y2L1R8_9PROT|nr:DMT family transporter [Thalassospira mesophila]OSQ38399.1 hypothetical protein TMES_11170 [Thalassospira mesophila]
MKALLLLLGAGVLGGTSILLAKLAVGAGLTPLSYLFWQCLGAGGVLLGISALRRDLPSMAPRYLRYYFVAGLVSLAVPMGVGYFMVPHIGAALAGIFTAMPPLMTYLLSMCVGLERARFGRMLGLMAGFVGVLFLYLPQLSAPDNTLLVYLLIAAIIPVSLAMGNVYRTADWPVGANPIPLAAGMMLASAVYCLGFEMMRDRLMIPSPDQGYIWGIIGVQIVVAALMYMCHFELQRVAGPVYLSQIGYIMALTTLIGGVALFNEALRPELLITLGCVVLGTFLVRPGHKKPASGAADA